MTNTLKKSKVVRSLFKLAQHGMVRERNRRLMKWMRRMRMRRPVIRK
jgi:hypothetical protein